MGTRLNQQKRGKGGPAYRSPGHRFFGKVAYERPSQDELESAVRGQVVEFVDDVGRSPLLVGILLENGHKVHCISAEGLKVGDFIEIGREAKLGVGCITPLMNLPEGTPVFNIELVPGDGGKIARVAGASAQVVSRDEEKGIVGVLLASKAIKIFLGRCRATVGVACGGGRLEKPFKKAGNKWFAMRALNHEYPVVRRTAMSAYDHPHGGRSFGKSSTRSHDAPPGKKCGQIGARRTGRRK
ncbi:TPA: 50S ribosomal protein L2 [Candidatus Micrarchaeota archaeon]|nr:MAG: 50S ribosomal protein L2 [Candidatus Micrarchaeota archaeon CG1_02_51_15]HII38894.1 50S ribosomal protein L2 [Candidatus Micrarchaeota archaeon]